MTANSQVFSKKINTVKEAKRDNLNNTPNLTPPGRIRTLEHGSLM